MENANFLYTMMIHIKNGTHGQILKFLVKNGWNRLSNWELQLLLSDLFWFGKSKQTKDRGSKKSKQTDISENVCLTMTIKNCLRNQGKLNFWLYQSAVCLQNTYLDPFKIQKFNARLHVCLDKPVVPDYRIFFQASCLLTYSHKCKQKNHKAFSYLLYLHFCEL